MLSSVTTLRPPPTSTSVYLHYLRIQTPTTLAHHNASIQQSKPKPPPPNNNPRPHNPRRNYLPPPDLRQHRPTTANRIPRHPLPPPNPNLTHPHNPPPLTTPLPNTPGLAPPPNNKHRQHSHHPPIHTVHHKRLPRRSRTHWNMEMAIQQQPPFQFKPTTQPPPISHFQRPRNQFQRQGSNSHIQIRGQDHRHVGSKGC